LSYVALHLLLGRQAGGFVGVMTVMTMVLGGNCRRGSRCEHHNQKSESEFPHGLFHIAAF
jgi:hypothetical protein